MNITRTLLLGLALSTSTPAVARAEICLSLFGKLPDGFYTFSASNGQGVGASTYVRQGRLENLEAFTAALRASEGMNFSAPLSLVLVKNDVSIPKVPVNASATGPARGGLLTLVERGEDLCVSTTVIDGVDTLSAAERATAGASASPELIAPPPTSLGLPELALGAATIALGTAIILGQGDKPASR